MNRPLVVIGLALVLAGLAWPWLRRVPLFHLPGDIVVDRPGWKFYFPIVTMIFLSIVLSALAWLLRK